MMAQQQQQQKLRHNIVAAVVTIVYVKTVVFVSNFLVERRIVSSRISRKIVHIAAGSWIVMWPLFVVAADGDGDGDDDDEDDWSWRLNITVPVVYSITLFYKGLFLPRSAPASASSSTTSTSTSKSSTKPPIDPDVQSMTRTGDPRELLNGPLVFTVVMCIVGGVRQLFRSNVACIVMSCLGWGDGVAPLVGYYYPYGKYPTWPFRSSSSSSTSSITSSNSTADSNNYKTISGSVAFWLSSIIGYYVLASVALLTPFQEVSTATTEATTFIPLSIVVQIATTSTVAESLTGPYDNVAVAITAGLTYYYLVVG